MTADDEIVGNDDAAAYVGMKPATWRSRVYRKSAPPPDRREPISGHAMPVWKRSTLDAWMKRGREGRP